MDDKSILSHQSEISLNESMTTISNEELENILNNLQVKGEIKDKKHPLVAFIKDKRTKIKKSKIKYSYTSDKTIWKEFQIEDNIYLFRITNKINDNIKELIKNEFKIHEECEDLSSISPEFICFYFSNFLNFSVFVIKEYYTLEEILTKKNLPDFSNDGTFLEFKEVDLFSSTLETIKNLKINNEYYITPYITPSDLLYTESSGKEFFLLSEIFLKADSIDKEISLELDLKNVKEWTGTEFVKNKAKVSFASNVTCLGNIFNFYYKIAFKDIQKRPINIKESIYKELIDNCFKTEIKEGWEDRIQECISSLKEIEEIKSDKNINSELHSNDNKETTIISNDDLKENKIDINQIHLDIENSEINNINIYENKEILRNDIYKKIENEENFEENIINEGIEIMNRDTKKNQIENIERDENNNKELKLEKDKKIKEDEEMKQKIIEKEKIDEKEKLQKENEKMKKLIEEGKIEQENFNKQKEIELQRKLEEEKKIKEEEEKKKIEEEKKKEEEEEKLKKEREEKDRLYNIELEKLKNENKLYSEELEKMKKEEQKRLEEEKKEKEKKEKEKRERELLEKKKKEKERIEKEKKEKEILEEEKRRQIQIENERRKIINLKEEKERKEREKKEEEERKKREEERKKLEEKQTKNFPDAISFINEKNTNVEIKLIHLEVEFKNKPKDIEAFDIFGPSKPGYKFIYIENNKYYTVFPFYKFSNRSIIFGIRDTKEKKFIDNNDIEGKHLEFRAKPKQWELNIMRKKDSENIFNILNVPKEINKFRYLKFLNKLNLKNYSFNFDCIREVTNALSYQEILDYIMEIGMNKLSEMLVKILIEKKIDIYHISNYLENYKNTRFKNNFYEKAPELIFSFSSKNFEKEEKNENNEKENNNDNYAQRKCLLCLDPNIPMNFYPDNYQKDLISKTIEYLGISSLDNKEYLEIKRNEINKKLSEFNKSQNFHGLKEIICILTDSTVKKIAQLEYGILANIPIIIQGFTSAGKSFLASVASKINKKDCLSTALSEHTTTEDLLGRDVIKDDSSIKFIPGILLSAYKNGKTLILDECDLAKPEILS